ncbi:hypothetical protein ACFVAJ_16455 [Agromyces sp. NPDC057679]|uniref:hypothetical protein n=1 Tax=Agromyces sp. NPDC057679 TaxID=3346207 RepID=UPI00366A8D2D
MEFEADWEARFGAEDLIDAQNVDDLEHARLVELARSDIMAVATAAQKSPSVTVNDLAQLIEERVLVPAGAFANPNFGRLPLEVQFPVVQSAFPEERLVAARNADIHRAVIETLASDESPVVREAAKQLLSKLATVEGEFHDQVKAVDAA